MSSSDPVCENHVSRTSMVINAFVLILLVVLIYMMDYDMMNGCLIPFWFIAIVLIAIFAVIILAFLPLFD